MKHICKIACNTLPLVGEANFMIATKPMKHVNRVAKFHVLIYLLKGGMEIVEDGETYTLKPGTLFFLKHQIPHWGIKEYEKNTSWYYIHFYAPEPDDYMQELTTQYCFSSEYSVNEGAYSTYISLPKLLQLPLGNALEDELAHLIEIFHSNHVAKLVQVNIKLWQVLLRCFELKGGETKAGEVKRHLKHLLQFMEENYNRNFTALEIEEVVGLSYKYIGTLFKQEWGMTIKEYQLYLRMKEATRLLCETELPIKEIAEQIGYVDAFYFSNIFKREKGISPRKFRNHYEPSI